MGYPVLRLSLIHIFPARRLNQFALQQGLKGIIGRDPLDGFNLSPGDGLLIGDDAEGFQHRPGEGLPGHRFQGIPDIASVFFLGAQLQKIIGAGELQAPCIVLFLDELVRKSADLQLGDSKGCLLYTSLY